MLRYLNIIKGMRGMELFISAAKQSPIGSVFYIGVSLE